jgi:hypothetical protein
MSSGDDNLISRWSRRKLAARSAEAPAADEKEHAPGEAAAVIEASGPALQPEVPEETTAEGEAAETPEPLPRIEDLTAESDLTAFLRKGIPMALKSAAMRKMWSLNPAIRDYVGPAEYAWDFNQPGSMGGFGPLEAKETVVSFLSKTVRELEGGTDEPAAVPAEPQAADSEQRADATSEGGPDMDLAQSPQYEEPIQSEPRDQPPSDAPQQIAEVRPTTEPATPSRPGPRHGSALPR